MSVITNSESFFFDHYLTSKQKLAFNSFGCHLQKLIKEVYLNSNVPAKIETACLATDIEKQCSKKEFHEMRDLVLYSLLKNVKKDLNKYLLMILKICQRDGESALFKCASSKKLQLYEPLILIEIIGGFYDYIQATNQSLEFLKDFPAYDEGGKECLVRLKNNPRDNPLILFFENEAQKREEIPVQKLFIPFNAKDLLENAKSFTDAKTGAIQYLSSLAEQHRSPLQVYLKFFQEVQNDHTIGENEKIALVKLVVCTTSNANIHIGQHVTLANLKELISEIRTLSQKWGEETFLSFCSAPNLQQEKFSDVNRAIHFINTLSEDFVVANTVFTLCEQFSSGRTNLTQFLIDLEAIAPQANLEEIALEGDINALLERFINDANVSFPLSVEKINIIKTQYNRIQMHCENWKRLRMSDLVNLATELRQKEVFVQEDLLKIIAIGRLALRIKFQTYPHNTQVLTVLGLLECGRGQNNINGSIAQVKTGEGKSLIVSLLAFTLGMQNKGVHIISSSRQLAMRDQQKTEDFFTAFDIKTSHICQDDREAQYFQAPILYGTATDFEFAIMREMLYGQKIFPQSTNDVEIKRFDYVIVDELDNLTIDTASNSAQVSYPAEITHDWVYFPIFEFAKQRFQANIHPNFEMAMEPLKIYLNEYLNGRFQHLALQLSNNQLFNWLRSAYSALFIRKENKHYIVGHTENGEKAILIIDAENTGRIQHGSRWQEGLHEFVEIKHNIPPQKENLNPLSLSHPVFYQMYRNMYGLTGTIGSNVERETIKEIYHVNSFDVPTYYPSRRLDSPLQIVESNEIWLQSIINKAKACIQNGRPFLGLCSTIHDTQVIQQLLVAEEIEHQLMNEMQEKSEEEILSKAGLPGAVTIATNTAGRGTDIKITEESNQNGGLHVCLTFFPESERVEYQGRGRAGRKGERGSSEMIVSLESLNLLNVNANHNYQAVIQFLRKKREKKIRLSKYIQICQSIMERFSFSLTKQFFSEMNKLNEFLGQEIFLKKHAETLTKRLVADPTKLHLINLKDKDKQIAEDAINLLSIMNTPTSTWKNILTMARKRVKDKVINLWSQDYYKNMKVIIQPQNYDFVPELWLQIHNQLIQQINANVELEELYIDIDNALNVAKEERLTNLKNQIRVLFDECSIRWNKYMEPSGSGIIEYIREITLKNLKNV